jgi:poly(A) polymerase
LGGLSDLTERRVRFIEDPDKRIAEDYLRILRFFRFHAWYGDQDAGLDADGLAACAAGIDGLDSLSKERVGAEVAKLLGAPHPERAVAAMAQAGILGRVIEGADHRMLAPLIDIEAKYPIRWQRRLAVLGGEGSQKALRLSRKNARMVDAIRSVAGDTMPAEHAAYLYGLDIALDGYLVRCACLSQPIEPDFDAKLELGATSVFPITGRDLADDVKGKELGDLLKRLEQSWMQSGFRLSRQDLLDMR